jgi:HK97 family phage prohead protease
MAKQTSTREFKTFSFQVKAIDDDQGLIEAYGSVFGNEDEGCDIVDQGSFKRTIKNSKSRVAAGKSEFLAMMLWNHDAEHFLPIGGWYDLQEDTHGLLGKGKIIINTQLGRDVYTLIKEKVINEFSIGYEVMENGSYYEKSTGIRHLTELRLWEVSPVVFAMNTEALLVGIKRMDVEDKSVCGSTSGAIGPRDEAWDGSAAEDWIWSEAVDEEDNVKPAIAKRYFMRVDGDPKLKGSYSYPFWTHGHISIGGVKAVANALEGARNADAGGDSTGMKRKIERLYSRINSKYPDDPKLVPSWNKSSDNDWEHKDLSDHFQGYMGEDLCEDWQDVYLCALTCAVFDAFKDGGDPETDVTKALDDFKQIVVSKFIPEATAYDLCGYLEDHQYTGEYLSQYGNDSRPSGYMSRQQRLSRKELLAADATTGGFYAGDKTSDGSTTTSVAKLHQTAQKAMKTVTQHVEQLHNAADEVDTLIGGLAPIEKSSKTGRTFSTANSQALSNHAETIHDLADTHNKVMMKHMKSISTAANDLATILQGSEAAYGTDVGKPAGNTQEGKALADALQELRLLHK